MTDSLNAREVRGRIRAFADFALAQQRAEDLDPAYPVIRWLLRDDQPAVRALAIVQYVAVYQLGSWWALWSGQLADSPDRYSLPTGIERRGLRDPERMRRHMREVWDLEYGTDGGLTAFLAPPADAAPTDGWIHVVTQAGRLWGNGRWAAYKTADLCAEVLGWRITAPDAGMDGASGPRQGLESVFGPDARTWDVEECERRAAFLRLEARRCNGVNLKISEVETVLCDFHGGIEGRYYPGHDVDQMQEQLTALEARGYDMSAVWRARAETLPHAALGEISGWPGVDRPRRKHLAQHGVVLDAWEGRGPRV